MLSVRDIMVPNPVVVSRETSVGDALRAMVAENINSVVVCDDGVVEGIFTPRDLMQRATDGWDTTPVAALMTPRPITVPIDESFARAAELMDEGRIRHLPVTDGEKLVGVVSVRDLMHHRAAELEGLVRQQTAELEMKNAQLEERHRLMTYHLDLAGRIQRQLLPAAAPDFGPFSLAVGYHPLERVSGDCYDFVALSPDRFGILIADACGHGVPAAFVSVMARTIFQAYGRRAESPAAVLATMNEQLPCLIEEDHFITMCYASVDRKTMRMTYAKAGHPSPLWFRHAESRVESLAGDGHMIGVLDEVEFEDRTVQLRPDDAVLFFTDGLIECRNAQQEPFGRDRVIDVLREKAGSAPAIVAALESELEAFCGGRAFGDDVTCLALTVDAGADPSDF